MFHFISIYTVPIRSVSLFNEMCTVDVHSKFESHVTQFLTFEIQQNNIIFKTKWMDCISSDSRTQKFNISIEANKLKRYKYFIINLWLFKWFSSNTFLDTIRGMIFRAAIISTNLAKRQQLNLEEKTVSGIIYRVFFSS